MKLGSLFDGSGGFPLAGMLFGIEPVWASEIEPFPIRVTKLRFPNMRHLGSVTEVNGAEVEPVDIVTFGSPCQDLSVAGKQAGIHEGERSNLFFEAIRIIKEMRHATATQFPRFAVWENVPGAFSSNKGEDFRAVLQAFCEISDPGVHVPEPPRGGWKHAGCIVGDGYSVAWRLYDAQFWGVPQRRKRIYLIADFRSERAGEILFEREGVSGDPEPGGTARQGTAADAEGSVAGDDCAGNVEQACSFMGGQGAKARSIAYCDDGSTPTLKSAPSGGNTVPDVCYALKGNAVDRDTKQNGRPFGEGSMYTLDATDRHAVAFGIDQQGGKNNAGYAEGQMPTLCSDSHGTPHAVCFQQNQRDEVRNLGEHAGTVIAQAGARNKNYVCFGLSRSLIKGGAGSTGGIPVEQDMQPSITANGCGGVAYDARGNGGGGTNHRP